MKEKTTKLQLIEPRSKKEIINALGFKVETRHVTGIRFNKISITNRCPPELIN